MKRLVKMTLNSSFRSGFCLHNEEALFEEYLEKNDFTLSGFSFGAQKVFEEAYSSKNRVDKIQLISPAFFQNKDLKYKRMQLMFFKKDAKTYCENFLKNLLYPTHKSLEAYFSQGSYEELESLLYYVWDEKKLEELVLRGVKIEVFLGDKDKIIDASAVKAFFLPFATVYYIKNAGHIL
ncbi:MAG: pimelyl-ACP methyl ester esterase BioV [Candidatus Marinarcus sp.]|uniref:pimelyl-ACP methyl ester esterase BioV n=1 Tax=Candidatus Marinarcus sp. TaxID=3100987 RepID=UPI003B003376